MTEYNFNAVEKKNEIVAWIKEFFKTTKGEYAIVGISGGKDSSIVAALCAEALGSDKVIGCLLPSNIDGSGFGIKNDQLESAISKALTGDMSCFIDFNLFESQLENISAFMTGVKLCKQLGIKYFCRDIAPVINECYSCLPVDVAMQLTKQMKINLPARIRMTLLYAAAQVYKNGRVANTSNLSEDWVGYATRWGDSVGDFAPIANFTVTEVKQIGKALQLPKEFINRIPADGLSGKTDEENFGFSYDTLDRYIRFGEINDRFAKEAIDIRHKMNKFKMEPITSFKSNLPIAIA